MTQQTNRSKRGRDSVPGEERAGPRVGPLLGAPPPIVFRTPQRPGPRDDAPGVSYRVLTPTPTDGHGVLELSADRKTRIPALSVICCVTGVSLADIAPTILDRPLQVRFMIPDVPGNIRLETSDTHDTSVSIQHPPARTRSFGVERMRASRLVAVPKLPPFGGFRRR